MKKTAVWLLVIGLAIIIARHALGEKKPLPEIKLDDAPLMLDEPLLLEEPKEMKPEVPHDGPMADNSRCYVCHANYDGEELTMLHAPAKIGCESCHGSCDAHCSDEDNITPPDTMYPKSKIDAACSTCHEDHLAPARAVIKRWQERCPSVTDASQLVCTDCHGEHRLTHRTRRWDKSTRKLIEDDKVRMIDHKPKPE